MGARSSRRPATGRAAAVATMAAALILPGAASATAGAPPVFPSLEPIQSSSVVVGGPGAAYTATFPSRLGRRGITIRKRDAWVSYRLEGARGAGARAGRALVYPTAVPNVAAVYVPAHQAIKEVLALRPNAPSSYRFILRTSRGLRAVRTARGHIEVVDRRGVVIFSLARPFMHDGASPRSAVSRAVSLRVARLRRGSYRITLAASRSWLESGARDWPVVIDPTINLNPRRSFCDDRSPPAAPLDFVRCYQPDIYAHVIPKCTFPTSDSVSSNSCADPTWWATVYLPGLTYFLTSPVVVYTPELPPPSLAPLSPSLP